MDEKLIKKLKLDAYENISVIKNSKDHATSFDGYEFKNQSKNLDLAIAFVYSLDEMKDVIKDAYRDELIKEDGLIYLVYPKNKNKLGHASIHRDDIFPHLEVDDDGYVKDMDFKFNKMVALDENYTIVGVKNLVREKNKKSTAPSGRVDDYIDKIEDLEAYLKRYPDQLEFYKNLTPGYRKSWARYVYSARTEKTINKRLTEMVDLLKQGKKVK